jgi:uncharacterized membrane protein YiaA
VKSHQNKQETRFYVKKTELAQSNFKPEFNSRDFGLDAIVERDNSEIKKRITKKLKSKFGIKKSKVKETVATLIDKKLEKEQTYPPSEEEVRRKYNNANTMSIISLVCLVLGLFTGGLTILVAIILSAIALSTYRNYENPGMMERRSMAIGVFIASLVIIGVVLLLVGLWIALILAI